MSLFSHMFHIIRNKLDEVEGPKETIRSWVIFQASSGNNFRHAYCHAYSDLYKNFKDGFLRVRWRPLFGWTRRVLLGFPFI